MHIPSPFPRFRLALFLLCALAAGARARTWTVEQDGTGDFTSIEPAIQAARNGDEVVVGPGRYLERLIFAGEQITLRSRLGAAATIVDADSTGSVMTLMFSESRQTVVDGFTLTGGTGTRIEQSPPAPGGAAPTASPLGSAPAPPAAGDPSRTPEDRAALLRMERAGEAGPRQSLVGGGIALLGTAPVLRNLVLTGNGAEGGGGLFGLSSAPLVENCRFVANFAGDGAGAMLESSRGAEFHHCVFTRNQGAFGAGIMMLESAAEFYDCTIQRNLCGFGGGLYLQDETVEPTLLDHCVFWRNVATEASAIRVIDAILLVRSCTLAGNGIEGTTGAALDYDDGSSGSIERSIVASNTPGGIRFRKEQVTTSCNDFWEPAAATPGSRPGPEDFSLEPRLCALDQGNLYLQQDSPCAPDHSPDGCGLVGALGTGCDHPASEIGGE